MLQPLPVPFDSEHVASSTCLVRFNRNRYSVMAKAAHQAVQVRGYATRIVIRRDGAVVGEHERVFGRNLTIFDPWHYLPILAGKPGALRNGAPCLPSCASRMAACSSPLARSATRCTRAAAPR